MKIASKTDIGRIRLVNEDRSIVIPDLNGFTLAIVADGMGGHQAGDIASQMAIEMIQEQLRSIHREMEVEQCIQQIKIAIEKANQYIFDFAAGHEQYRGMGTTVVVTLATDDGLIIGHIGDSRAYILHQDQMTQLTEDHSLVTELVRNGQITQEEADHHPRRNVLTRALGTESEVDVEVRSFLWQSGDIVLLCSDGLSGLVDQRSLFESMHAEQELTWKANHLVDTALEAGGDDNITVVLLANE